MPEFSVKLKAAAEPDRELLLLMPEIFIFSSCLEIIQKMRRLELKFQKGRMKRSVFLKRITLLLSHLAEMAGATERFNILTPVPGVGQFSPFFWRWFNWWNDYRRTLTRAEISHLERLGKAGNAELDNYRPAGDWLHYRQAPALALQIVDSGE
jgi:hypothetical protein